MYTQTKSGKNWPFLVSVYATKIWILMSNTEYVEQITDTNFMNFVIKIKDVPDILILTPFVSKSICVPCPQFWSKVHEICFGYLQPQSAPHRG